MIETTNDRETGRGSDSDRTKAGAPFCGNVTRARAFSPISDAIWSGVSTDLTMMAIAALRVV